MFTYVDQEKSAKIKVIGVGGAGGNAINNMIASNLKGVKFISANTDGQALEISRAPIGGTGTGAAPVIAEICKDMGALTVAVVTKPFAFEGKKRTKVADDGIEILKKVADTAITIPNDRLRGLASKNAKLVEMFLRADEILLHSVKGITDLIMMPGLVNLDFADVKTTMSKAGMAIMGIGIAAGENRAVEAAERAMSHPLLEDIPIAGAKGVLMNITSTSDMEFEEVAEASERIHSEVGDDADIFWGTSIDDSLGDEMRVTVRLIWKEKSLITRNRPLFVSKRPWGSPTAPFTEDTMHYQQKTASWMSRLS
jgi:cell division protein FtsZ